MRLRAAIVSAFACAVLLAAPSVHGQEADWPTKPVRFIVRFPPGGTVALQTFMLAEIARWGKVVRDNDIRAD